MVRRIVVGLVVIILIGAGAFAILSSPDAIDPERPPPASAFSAELVTKGAVLAAGGDCANCHTAKGGAAYAGGDPIHTDFGDIYATNITPDPETGIGGWSEAAFRRALWQGVSRDGSQLLPAFPFDHFTKLSEADVSALYAYFMTRAPIHQPPHPNGLAFPLNIRQLQVGWKLLFFRSGRYVEQPERGADWNRGAYLAEGLGHCAACHSPRNALGAERTSDAYAGSVLDGRGVPALTQANTAPVPWSQEELYAYLRTGTSSYHGQPGGLMREVVEGGLSKLPDSDIRGLSVYFAAIGNTAARAAETQVAVQRALAADSVDFQQPQDAGARLYVGGCASCHYSNGTANIRERPNLAFVSMVNAADPSDLISSILHGHGAVMPAFGDGLDDADIALIAGHLRASRTGAAPWPDLPQKVAAIRAKDASQPPVSR